MNIEGVIWLESVIDKLASKHGVETFEVEEVLAGRPKFRFAEKGDREGEDVYLALGQTESGRYLTVYFIHKKFNRALVLSARGMADKERKWHGRKYSQILPAFTSLDELVDFFDTHDLGDYLDQMPEAHFDVNLGKTARLIAIDEATALRLTEIARQEQVSPEILINQWLQERISSYAGQAGG